MSQTAKRIIFTGRVQGIGFRFTALNIANRCKLTGFVRNMPDNSVEMLIQGSADSIADCIRDINESFTGYLRETNTEEVPYDPQFKNFKITF